MKILSILLLTVTMFTSAQNPDGKNASLHLTPVWSWGSADFNRSTTLWFPPTQASPEQSFSVSDAGNVTQPLSFGIHSTMKIPTASFLTLCISYSFAQRFEEFNKSETETKYYAQYWKINGTVHTVSVTASVYNLFSVYHGE